jgi:hypothetical protein
VGADEVGRVPAVHLDRAGGGGPALRLGRGLGAGLGLGSGLGLALARGFSNRAELALKNWNPAARTIGWTTSSGVRGVVAGALTSSSGSRTGLRASKTWRPAVIWKPTVLRWLDPVSRVADADARGRVLERAVPGGRGVLMDDGEALLHRVDAAAARRDERPDRHRDRAHVAHAAFEVGRRRRRARARCPSLRARSAPGRPCRPASDNRRGSSAVRRRCRRPPKG